MGAWQKVFMVMTALAAAICMVHLQGRFDAADVKNGMEIAKTYRAPSGKTLVDVLVARHPGSAVEWSAVETSSCFEHVRVDARVVPQRAAPPTLYQFDVDLNGPSIHPANGAGADALGALDAPRTFAADGGPAL
jgi:hypothetical protein